MIIEGYGGRGGNDLTDYLELLAGLIGFEDRELMPVTNCSNPKCGRPFRPRAEGDDFCNERCDPLNRLVSKRGPSNDDDPSWETARRKSE